jgi:hypothetical protein
MKVVLVLSILIISTTSIAAEVYVWEDDNNVIHFSDAPQHPDAKKITLADDPLTSPGQPSKATTTTDMPGSDKEKQPPLSIDILTPIHDATVRSNPGTIRVEGQLQGHLKVGQTIQLLLDNRPYGAPQVHALWLMKNIDRGTHTLTLQIIENGKIIASSNTITVHLHRASVQ